MSYRTKLIFLLITFLCVCQLMAQNKITSSDWQNDLRFLQQRVHDDYKMLFYKISKKDFDKAVEKLYVKIPKMKDHEIKVAIAEIVALFGYGHTTLSLIAWNFNQNVNFHQLPLNMYWFKDGVYVQGGHKDYKKAIGARVIKIGKMSILDALEAIKPVVSAENDQFFKAFGLHYLTIPEILNAKGVIEDISNVNITLKKDGQLFTLNVTPGKSKKFPGVYGLIQTHEDWLDARSLSETPYWLKNLNKRYYFEYLASNKTVYVRQSSVFHDIERIDDFYERVFKFVEENEVERLVIDLRLNAGGDNFNNKAVITGLIKSEKINQTGKLFVILGRRTFSAAQNLVNEIENYTNAIFVGEPTAENVNFFGDARSETLPNSKLQIRLSFAWWQDKNPWDKRPWTAPSIAVELKFADYIKNYDPILNTIFKASDLEQHLSNIFQSKKTEEIRKAIISYVKDPSYHFYNFENRINMAGYNLIKLKQANDAVFLFKLNTELFPESANGWDSLAEGYWRNGDIESAKKYYNKVIQMDPESRIAENSRNMLRRINAQ